MFWGKKSQTRSIYIILPVILSTESYLRGFFFKKTTQTQYLIQGEKNISLRGHGELFSKSSRALDALIQLLPFLI